MVEEPTIEVPLQVGALVTVLTDVDTDEENGFMASTVFEDRVEQYSPETRKLAFAESDISYSEFCTLLREHKSVQIIHD